MLFTVPIVLIASASGCRTTNFGPPIGSFKSSVETGSAAVATYFTEMNRFEREVYLSEVAHDPDIELATSVINEKGEKAKTALSGKTFSPKSVQARVDALRLVGLYAQGLSELAGTDAATTFGESTKKFAEQLKTTFSGLADDTSAAYIAPLTSIAAEFGKMAIEWQRDIMLRESIKEAAPAIRDVLTLLESDLTTIVKPLRDTGTKQMLTDAIRSYNADRAKMSLEQRKAALAKISAAYDRADASVAADPAAFVRSMRSTFDKLVTYAESDHRPKDLPSLIQHLKSLEDDAKRLWASVEEIRNIRRGG